ncbi:hypothetical protein F5Y07DRAFT_388398 [Xylaria sp. FL0933]|nr:hypothetical protein F5Y07DRAFT_388398 [Xylaria sp. FL0933]
MKAALIRRTVVLFGLVALAATCVGAQGTPDFGGVNNWGPGSGSSNNDPYNSNDPTSSSSDNSNNTDDSGNSNDDGSSGDSSGDGSSSDSGDDSSSSSSDNGNSVIPGGNGFGGNGGGGGDTSGGGDDGDDGSFSPSLGSGLGFPYNENGLSIEGILNFPVIHGALATLAFGFLFPLGAILMRVIPGKSALYTHGFIQILAYTTYIAGAGLGLYLASSIQIPSGAGLLDIAGENAHPIIGIVLLVALLFQPVLGLVHHRRFKKLRRRTWVSHAHLWTGRLGITLGIINGGLGFALARRTSGAGVVAYSVVSGTLWLIWVLTAVFAEVRRGGDGNRRVKEKRASSYSSSSYMPAVRGGGPDSTRPPSIDHSRNRDGLPRGEYPPPPDASMDVPSPPYTPGPHYEAHMAQVRHRPGERGEMANMKEVLEGSDAVSVMSASQDEMRRGQV